MTMIENPFNVGPSTPFRDHQNRRFLRQLFIEWDKSGVFTLRDQDKDQVPSLYRLYMESGDLTEYQFANAYLENWEHWQMLCSCSWFKPYIERWRTELELKVKADALKAIVALSKGDDKNSYNALRFIVEKGWIDKKAEPSRRGRPSKDEINKLAQEELFNDKQIQADLKRMDLNATVQ